MLCSCFPCYSCHSVKGLAFMSYRALVVPCCHPNIVELVPSFTITCCIYASRFHLLMRSSRVRLFIQFSDQLFASRFSKWTLSSNAIAWHVAKHSVTKLLWCVKKVGERSQSEKPVLTRPLVRQSMDLGLMQAKCQLCRLSHILRGLRQRALQRFSLLPWLVLFVGLLHTDNLVLACETSLTEPFVIPRY